MWCYIIKIIVKVYEINDPISDINIIIKLRDFVKELGYRIFIFKLFVQNDEKCFLCKKTLEYFNKYIV